MAKIPQGILGGISGKIANIIGASWKGINYIRSLPVSVANPKTAGQVLQRSKMTNVTAFASPFNASFIKWLWDRFAKKASGWNDFISANIDLFELPVMSAPQDLVASTGQMGLTPMTNTAISAGDPDLTINWTDDSGQGFKLTTDEVYVLVAYRAAAGSTEYQFAYGSATTATRADGTVVITLPLNPSTGGVLNIYLCFRRTDGTIVSNNSYDELTVGP